MNNTYFILFLLSICLIAAGFHYGTIYQLRCSVPNSVRGKKEIYVKLGYLFTIVLVLLIAAALAIEGILSKELLGYIVVSILTALGIKKVEPKSGANRE